MKVAKACAGKPIGKLASIGYVPGGTGGAEGTEGRIRVVEKVPLNDVVTY